MSDKEVKVVNIFIHPNLVHTETKDGTPLVSKKDGTPLAKISVPPEKKDGEWGSFVIHADKVKEAKSETENGEKFKFISCPEEASFTVSYGKNKEEHREEDMPVKEIAKKFNKPKKPVDLGKGLENDYPEEND